MTSIEKLDPNFAPPKVDGDTVWHDIRTLGVEGRGWSASDCARPFDRLPAKAEDVVTDAVWSLSRNSTGMYVRFVSDATQIAARWTLLNGEPYMAHMPPTGHSGLDLYARLDGPWHFAGVAQPKKDEADQECLVVGNMESQSREFLLYLPLYNGVESVSIGVPQGASLEAAPSWQCDDARPICFYGTSIVQGGCASRPGMTYAAIAMRRLDRPAINLGFSGNGKCHPEVADLLAELDPCAYVLDPLPNLQEEQIEENCERFIRTLRDARPATPIVMIENITYQQAEFVPMRKQRSTTSNTAWRKVHDDLIASGMKNLIYVEGADLLGHDGDATVDGTHFTDLGYMRFAETLTKHRAFAALFT